VALLVAETASEVREEAAAVEGGGKDRAEDQGDVVVVTERM